MRGGQGFGSSFSPLPGGATPSWVWSLGFRLWSFFFFFGGGGGFGVGFAYKLVTAPVTDTLVRNHPGDHIRVNTPNPKPMGRSGFGRVGTAEAHLLQIFAA